MRLVHTADWHVGKSLRGRHRVSEYREILQELKEFLQQKQVDVLLVAGDVFDSNAPSAESEDIVYSFFHEVLRLGVQLIVIAGNHDSGLRFEAISKLMRMAGITMRGLYAQSEQDGILDTLITSKSGEQAHIFLLPFIPENIFVRAQDLMQSQSLIQCSSPTSIYSCKMGEVVRLIASRLVPNALHILVSHVLMHGARPGGGERRLYLGENYAFHADELTHNFDYVALGHIHLQQKMPGPCPIYYSGSPLQMDFGESNAVKGFLYLETQENTEIKPEFIPFQHGKKLLEVQGTWDEILVLSQKNPDIKNSYLKITVSTDTGALGLSYQVKKIFPNAIDIRREYLDRPQETAFPTTEWLPKMYQEYFRKENQTEAGPEVIQEFQLLYQKLLSKSGAKT